MPGFQTARLIARPVGERDRSDCQLTRNESELKPREASGSFLTLSQLNRIQFSRMVACRAKWASDDQHYVLGLFLRDSGRFIGDASLFNVDRTASARAEIGLVIYSPYQGRGLGREALRGCIEWGLKSLRLQQIYGYVQPLNRASINACLRAGFRLQSSVPVVRLFDGQAVSTWFITAP